MHVLVTGGAGMLGRKLADRLSADGTLGGEQVSELTLVDVVVPPRPAAGFPVEALVADLAEPEMPAALVSRRPDVVFHLAAVVSGEAEADLEKGYRVNVGGTRLLLDAIRLEGYRPRLVFASSIAVFGAPFPDVIGDEFMAAPLTSYGTQKAMGELLLCDYSRRGFVDGVGLRLPTICVRPGRPNRAATGFFSGIIREPLNGEEAVLPVEEDVRHWFASPRAAVEFFVHAATLDTGQLGPRRCLTMPGVSATVAEEIAALREVAGAETARLIRRDPDEQIMRMTAGWPRAFTAERALALGFRAEASFADIVGVYLEDELAGVVP